MKMVNRYTQRSFSHLPDKFYRIIHQYNNDILFFLDTNGVIKYQSSACVHPTGESQHLHQDCIAATKYIEYVHPEDRASVIQQLDYVQSSPYRTTSITHRMKSENNDWSYVEARIGNLLQEPEIGAIYIQINTGSHPITHNELPEKQEDPYRRMFRLYPQPMWIIDSATFRFLDVNEASCRLYGYSREEFLLMNFTDSFCSEDSQHHWVRPDTTVGFLPDTPLQCRHYTKNGDGIEVRMVAHTLDYEGKSAWCIVISDCTEQLLAQRVVNDTRDLLNKAQQIAKMGSWTLDLENNKLQWSDEIYRIFEIDPLKFAESYEAFLDAIHPDDREYVNTSYTESVLQRTRYSIEHRLLMADGRIKYVHEQGETVYSDDGRPLRSIGTVHDITERTLTEEKMRKHDKNMRNIIEAVTVPIVITNTSTGEILYANQLLADMMATTVDDIMQRRTIDVYEIDPQHRTSILELIKEKGFVKNYPIRRLRPDTGEYHWYLLSIHELVFDEQEALITTVYDISEQKNFEEELIKSQQRLSSIVDSAMDAILSIDSESRIVLFNKSAEKMFLTSAEDALGKPIERFIPIAARARHAEAVNQFKDGVEGTRYMRHSKTIGGMRSNGEEFPIEASISVIKTYAEKLSTVILRDVTEQRKVENKLREQASLLDIVPDAIIVCNLQFEIEYWSKGAEQVYGYTAEETIGRKAVDISCVGDEAEFTAAKNTVFATGEWRGEFWKSDKNGSKILIQGRWKLVRNDAQQPSAILITNSDITEKRSLQQQLYRAQRLESIGTLASGIAHDLNNILTPIVLGMELVKIKSTDVGTHEIIHRLITNVQRASGLIGQILTFAKGSSHEREPINVKQCIDEVVKMARETFPKEVSVDEQIPSEALLIDGNYTQIHQVIMNLCINARDAMIEKGGTLTISADYIVATESLLKRFIDAQPGRYVAITVQDTGKGIPVELQDKIYEPFFTTKEVGKGTGIGLTTVFAIVRNHGGFIQLESTENVGTKFTIFIPAQTTSPCDAHYVHSTEISPGNTKVLLVIDDEELVRTSTVNILKEYGYTVYTASSGAEALALCTTLQHRLSAVVTDVVMPGMNGIELTTHIRKLFPDIPILATSGIMLQGDIIARLESGGVSAVLHKPFTAGTLLTTITQLLRTTENNQTIRTQLTYK